MQLIIIILSSSLVLLRMHRRLVSTGVGRLHCDKLDLSSTARIRALHALVGWMCDARDITALTWGLTTATANYCFISGQYSAFSIDRPIDTFHPQLLTGQRSWRHESDKTGGFY